MDEQPVFFSREALAGVWANAVATHLTKHEFTIDFIRTDPVGDEAVCVARVSCSPHVVRDLLDRLEELWRQWLVDSHPKEGS